MLLKHKVIVAMDDIKERQRVIEIAKQLSGHVWGFKVHDAFDKFGPEIIGTLKQFGKVFSDMKLSDIPATVALRTQAHLVHGADIISIRVDAGEEALRRAVAVGGGEKIVAITTLTSEENADRVIEQAKIAYMAGVKNIVCSAYEVVAVRRVAPEMTIIVPGIRGPHDQKYDQERTASPKEAFNAGADLLVIGRPITKAADPLLALQKIMQF